MPILLRNQVKVIRLDYDAYAREAKEQAIKIIEKSGVIRPTHILHDVLFIAAKNIYIAKILQEWEDSMP